jgi:hypothetical protein
MIAIIILAIVVLLVLLGLGMWLDRLFPKDNRW